MTTEGALLARSPAILGRTRRLKGTSVLKGFFLVLLGITLMSGPLLFAQRKPGTYTVWMLTIPHLG
jgi:hypothetical protein